MSDRFVRKYRCIYDRIEAHNYAPIGAPFLRTVNALHDENMRLRAENCQLVLELQRLESALSDFTFMKPQAE